ncbi:MAG: GNAT family N-acetyltransferase [Candidatus Dormibacteria bacterium]
MAEVQLTTVAPEEREAFITTTRRFFGQGIHVDQDIVADVLTSGTLARVDGEDVGTCATIDFRLTVPGGARVPMDGVTLVVVSPVFRRRGVLRSWDR